VLEYSIGALVMGLSACRQASSPTPVSPGGGPATASAPRSSARTSVGACCASSRVIVPIQHGHHRQVHPHTGMPPTAATSGDVHRNNGGCVHVHTQAPEPPRVEPEVES